MLKMSEKGLLRIYLSKMEGRTGTQKYGKKEAFGYWDMII